MQEGGDAGDCEGKTQERMGEKEREECHGAQSRGHEVEEVGVVLQYVAVCCSMLQCVAVCCSVLQCVAV